MDGLVNKRRKESEKKMREKRRDEMRANKRT